MCLALSCLNNILGYIEMFVTRRYLDSIGGMLSYEN